MRSNDVVAGKWSMVDKHHCYLCEVELLLGGGGKK